MPVGQGFFRRADSLAAVPRGDCARYRAWRDKRVMRHASSGTGWLRAGRRFAAGRPKQMGPALLPTPLSPARGQPLLARLPANLQPLLARGHAWRPMSRPPQPCALRRPCGGFVTGARAGIRLSLPCCRPALAQRLRRARPCEGAGPRPRPFTGCSRARPTFAAGPGSCPARFLACPAAPRRSDPWSEPACLWPRPPARGLQIGAWTDAAAILGLKTFARSRRCRPAS